MFNNNVPSKKNNVPSGATKLKLKVLTIGTYSINWIRIYSSLRYLERHLHMLRS